MTTTERIEKLFSNRGQDEYHGEAVSQLEHALQAAMRIEAQGAAPTLIIAALLHDIGHLLHNLGEDAAERGIDDHHENLGERFLTKHFGPEVSEPVRLHVVAKRYLCATQPGYQAALSPASQQSLILQGGPMSAEEIREFETNPYYREAVQLRKCDDEAKIPKLPTPELGHYLAMIHALSQRDN